MRAWSLFGMTGMVDQFLASTSNFPFSFFLRSMDLIKPNFEEGGGGTFPQGGVAPLTPDSALERIYICLPPSAFCPLPPASSRFLSLQWGMRLLPTPR
jgi:hypothetical protein